MNKFKICAEWQHNCAFVAVVISAKIFVGAGTMSTAVNWP
jgi:hypothetical protein